MTIVSLAALLVSAHAQPPSTITPPQPPSIEVEVRNAMNSQVIEAAVVVMDIGTPPNQRRPTRHNGRTSFAIACTEDIKFWAELPNDPNFPNQSPRVACQPQATLITLKLRPSRRRVR